jgi:hypothetical protein
VCDTIGQGGISAATGHHQWDVREEHDEDCEERGGSAPCTLDRDEVLDEAWEWAVGK